MKNKGLGDSWRTPPQIIDFIQARFGKIQIDLCSSDLNAVCQLNINEDENFLDDKWINREFIDKGDLAYCNPPFSHPLPFIKQCVKWAEEGYAVAGILNLDSSTKWFNELVQANALIMPITGGRVSFLDENGDPHKGNNKPQFMFYLAPFLAMETTTKYININEIY